MRVSQLPLTLTSYKSQYRKLTRTQLYELIYRSDSNVIINRPTYVLSLVQDLKRNPTLHSVAVSSSSLHSQTVPQSRFAFRDPDSLEENGRTALNCGLMLLHN